MTPQAGAGLLSPEQHRQIASNNLWIALALWAIVGVLALLGVAQALNPDAAMFTRDNGGNLVGWAFVVVLGALFGLASTSRSRMWRRTVTSGPPAATGTGTVVGVHYRKTRATTTIDVDSSGRWLFTSRAPLNPSRANQPGHRVTVEWYSLGRTMPAACGNHHTGKVWVATTSHPRS